MYWILEILINWLVLWLAATLFPDVVQIENGVVLLMAAIIISIIMLICNFVVKLLMKACEATDSTFLCLMTIVITVVSPYVALSMIDSGFEDSFNVVGVLPKVLITICWLIAYACLARDLSKRKER